MIGTRHGEKQYETLLTREEHLVAEDMGGFFRIPSDKRDLNYDKYFDEGETSMDSVDDYNSQNTELLSVSEVKEILLKLDYIQQELKNWDR